MLESTGEAFGGDLGQELAYQIRGPVAEAPVSAVVAEDQGFLGGVQVEVGALGLGPGRGPPQAHPVRLLELLGVVDVEEPLHGPSMAACRSSATGCRLDRRAIVRAVVGPTRGVPFTMSADRRRGR